MTCENLSKMEGLVNLIREVNIVPRLHSGGGVRWGGAVEFGMDTVADNC